MTKSNTPSGELFSAEFREAVNRLRDKEPELLEEVCEREGREQTRPPREEDSCVPETS